MTNAQPDNGQRGMVETWIEANYISEEIMPGEYRHIVFDSAALEAFARAADERMQQSDLERETLIAQQAFMESVIAKKDAQMRELEAACESAIDIIAQLVPEPSARGVAEVVVFQLRAALRKGEGASDSTK